MERVFLRITRPDPSLVQRCAQLGVATVYEAMGVSLGRAQLLEPALAPVQRGRCAAGPAITACCHAGDNTMSHVAVSLAQPGDLLVIAGGDPVTALWGDLTSEAALGKGVAGVVLDGGVRDVAMIRQLGLPVWARTISPAKPVKGTPGSANVPVRAGGVLVCPGDVVLADDDGVLVVPRARLEEVLVRAEARAAKEEALRAGLQAGDPGTLYRTLGIGEILERTGVEQVDDTFEHWSHRSGA